LTPSTISGATDGNGNGNVHVHVHVALHVAVPILREPDLRRVARRPRAPGVTPITEWS